MSKFELNSGDVVSMELKQSIAGLQTFRIDQLHQTLKEHIKKSILELLASLSILPSLPGLERAWNANFSVLAWAEVGKKVRFAFASSLLRMNQNNPKTLIFRSSRQMLSKWISSYTPHGHNLSLENGVIAEC